MRTDAKEHQRAKIFRDLQRNILYISKFAIDNPIPSEYNLIMQTVAQKERRTAWRSWQGSIPQPFPA